MKILALDSSGMVATVALLEDDTLKAEYTIDYKKTHSQTLLPMLNEIKNMTELDLQTIDAIAVAEGPGSFTGLRIGSATAKGLGLSLEKPVIPVPTTDALAFNLYGHNGLICPIMDARRNQVYNGMYEWESGEFIVKTPSRAVDMDQVIAEVNELGGPVIFLGDGVPAQMKNIYANVQVPFYLAPAHLNRQRGAAVAALGAQMYADGIYEPAEFLFMAIR